MNKFYIQIVFFLLSITLYVKNETLAAEATSGEDTEPKLTRHCPTSEEIYEKNKHLLCTNSKETEEAVKFMSKAVEILKYHAMYNGYKICKKKFASHMNIYKAKSMDNVIIKKIYYTVYDPDKYNETINELWDPNHANPFNNGDVKIVRVYNPNLVMIQQRYGRKKGYPQKYFYALVSKAEISEGGTIIVMASANINDHNPSKKVYKNTIIEEANSFKTDINSEDDIRNGKLTKTFVNIAGYLIEKRDWRVDIAYVESIDGYDSFKQK
ncbi:fam-a protein [Plasmodium vinckei brucechwatti]|uniref:Fam-a protein n=1 Tax=Plasmodium vinckei brucechwatti TaxID=119398 RepID=A0A6V7RX67_PLAVN|nr:fam-a protein [Plasmodium vinckei brucechwatti]